MAHDDVLDADLHSAPLLSADLGLPEPVTTHLGLDELTGMTTVALEGIVTGSAVEELQPQEARELARLLEASVDLAERLTGPQTVA
ncbi:MAG: hypothetical protein Q7T56_08800 [Nocardioidaceae bacterium]|nr:hypothetical protein [Nocardioidaceae bacterium]